MIVTIDGPAGAGKSTVARILAERLGFEFLDTGAFYRAATLEAVRAEVSPANLNGLRVLLNDCQVKLEEGRVYLHGEDVTAPIRDPDITRRVRDYAELAVVRDFLTARSREWAVGKSVVTEGRDQGTVVFPHAAVKLFLTADPTERAARRWHQLKKTRPNLTLEEVLADQNERDRRDSERALAPLREAADAIHFDTTGMEADEVAAKLESLVRARMPARLVGERIT